MPLSTLLVHNVPRQERQTDEEGDGNIEVLRMRVRNREVELTLVDWQKKALCSFSKVGSQRGPVYSRREFPSFSLSLPVTRHQHCGIVLIR